jgi:hypothetical protein
MYIEYKGNEVVGPARIGWVTFSRTGASIHYGGRRYRRSKGYKWNYLEVASGERYWISGCRRDGADALYSTTIEIDADALEEYWVNVRKMPDNIKQTRLPRKGKYSR